MNCKHKLDTGYSVKPHEDTLGTLWEYIYTLQAASFLVFYAQMHPWTSNAIFGTLVHTPLDHQQKQCHLVVGHTLSYLLSKVELNWTNGS